MPLPGLAAVGLGIGALSALRGLTEDFPEFPVNAEDINREINQQMNQALARTASDTRRRLIGAGQEGSGTIDAAISQNQQRIRSIFENERQKALRLLRQAQFQRDVGAFQNLQETLGGLSNIGFGLAALGQGGNVASSIPNNLQTFVNASPLGLSNAANIAQPVQSLSPRRLPLFNQPLGVETG